MWPPSTAKASFNAQVAAHGLTLAGTDVHLLAHWITDRGIPPAL